MPFTLTMPKLSPTMEMGTIVKWHKREGDEVQEGDLLFEVATDKATVEYNALDPGFLRKILVQEGSDAKVNQPLAIFTATKNESIEGYIPVSEKEIKQEQQEEHKVEKKTKKKEESEKVFAEASTLTSPAFEPMPPLEKYTYEWVEGLPSQRIKASPLAKKLAKEQNLDLSQLKGTGPGGRIVSRDLKKAPHKGPVEFGIHKPSMIPPGTYEEQPLSPMRKAIGSRLQAAKTFIPHFYVQQEVNVSALFELKEHLKTFEIKVSFNDLIIRAVALTLREFPGMNSGYNSAKNTLIRFKTIDICIAVSIEGGLITPIIRHADAKNVVQISEEVKMLADLARTGKLKPEQYQGGSFTISNLGMYGIKDFQAVINPPQAAILAVGGMHEKPIVKNGQVVPGKIMELSLSSDHRVIDGAEAAQFIRRLQTYLENPSILIV
jgi:pyruvate dehydrogenase E2 component (dihydrolipoamide acetyltransferase)